VGRVIIRVPFRKSVSQAVMAEINSAKSEIAVATIDII
jgi:hypothetical protein